MTATAAPRPSTYRPQRGRTLLVVLTWVIGVLGAAAAVFFAAQAGDVPGATLSLLFALVPLPAILLMYWWLDRIEPEPLRYKWAAFVWGAVVAVAIALAGEGLIALWLDPPRAVLAAVVAPVVEELAKGLFLVLTLWRTRRIIDGVLDGLIVSGIVAIGFAAVENVGYYAASYFGIGDGAERVAGAEGVTLTFVVRGLFSPFAHPLFTSAIGIAIGLAVGRRSRTVRWALVTLGALVSIALHALWNGSLVLGGPPAYLVVYLVLAALLVALASVAVILRQRQLVTLWTSLTYIGQRGWIHPAEVPYLARFARRREARDFARAHGGRPAERVVEQYQRLATELAFVHDLVMRGRGPRDGVARTYDLLDRMYALRPGLRLPPALPPGVR